MIEEFISVKPPHWHNNRVHFYKYMSADTAKIVLKNGTLRWSAPSLFNDPFDVQFNMPINGEISRIKSLALDRMWMAYTGQIEFDPQSPIAPYLNALARSGVRLTKEEFIINFGSAFDEGFERMQSVLPEVNAEAAILLEDVKLLCLTIRPNNSLMWSHYADSHKGVVLRFRSIPALDSPYGMAKPVNYVEDIPNLIDESQIADIFAGINTIDKTGIMDRAVYTKSSEWSYEEEWRVNTGSGRSPGKMFDDSPFGTNEIDGLIFGVKATQEDRDELSKIATTYPNISLFNALKNPTSFTLMIEPC